MPTWVPDYDASFHCLAGECPHSCCIGWEVAVDPNTAAFYRTVPGPLGQKLRRCLTEREGEICFDLKGARCPFLDTKGLCRIHRELGEGATSVTCRSHPRFMEEYGPLREISLTASCPAAGALLLGSDTPLTFRELPGDGTEEAPALLGPLLALRTGAITLLENRKLPLSSRLGWFLLLSNEAQAALDEGRSGDLYALGEAAAELPTEVPVSTAGPGLFPEAWGVLEELEILGEDWLPLLAKARRQDLEPQKDAPALERITVYFLFRYLLKAVKDEDLLSRAELTVFAVLVVARLAACLEGSGRERMTEALRRFSREIEHSRKNLDDLYAAFCQDPRLTLKRFFRELERLSVE